MSLRCFICFLLHHRDLLMIIYFFSLVKELLVVYSSCYYLCFNVRNITCLFPHQLLFSFSLEVKTTQRTRMHKILHPEDLPMIDCYKGLIPEMLSIGNVHQTKTSHQRVYIFITFFKSIYP